MTRATTPVIPAAAPSRRTRSSGRAFLIIWPPSQIRDLPIPSTFQQAALHAGAAGAAVLNTGESALAAAPVAGAAGIVAAPVLLLRRRRRR